MKRRVYKEAKLPVVYLSDFRIWKGIGWTPWLWEEEMRLYDKSRGVHHPDEEWELEHPGQRCHGVPLVTLEEWHRLNRERA